MNENVTLSVTRNLCCDVVVIGGGVAGTAAAIAAARNGAKTVLIESGGCLGGQATVGIVTPLDARQTNSGKSFGGLIKEISDKTIELSRKYCSCGAEGSVSDIASPHILKYVLVDMASDAGVELHFHSELLAVNTNENSILEIFVSDKSGILKINAKSYIDASGDADLVFKSGAEYSLGSEPGVFEELLNTGLNKSHFSDNKYGGYSRSGLMQPVSIFFTMGGVDVDKAYELNNKDLKFGDLGITKEKFLNWEFVNTCGFEINGDTIPMPQGRVLVTRTNRPDIAVINMSRVINIDGSDADSLNNGEVLAQKQVIAIVDFLKTFIPGFENSYYIQSGLTLGVRETRRMVGEYLLSGTDAINCKRFSSVVARGSYIIDIHDPSGKARAIGGSIKGDFYDIPYESLVSKTYGNLLACGRCISADHIAHSSTRIQGTCIMTGQAAGTAAAIAAKQNIFSKDIDISSLQDALKNVGVFLD